MTSTSTEFVSATVEKCQYKRSTYYHCKSVEKNGTQTRPLMTKSDLMAILRELPDDSKIAIYSDPETGGSFYIDSVEYNPLTNRIVMSNPGCNNANDADAMDKGEDWHHHYDD